MTTIMHESLPPALANWVARQAEKMALPSPDDYILLLLKMEKQAYELEPIPDLYRRVFKGVTPPIA